jgi:8-amino-7-oxononanoate synthase
MGKTLASPIVPVLVGDESRGMATAARLRERGLLVPAVRYPTVPRGKARLRISVTAAHRESDLEALASALQE